MKSIFENVIKKGGYDLTALLAKIDTYHIEGKLTDSERDELYRKIRCCANEFVRYAAEHRPDVDHASLTDAMSCFEIEWDGVAHTSMADTVACMKVWEVLFPNYYAD